MDLKTKQKLIKSGFFAVATILVLVAVTVAWFVSGSNQAGVDNVQAGMETGKYSLTYFESPDQDKNGEIDSPATWVPVSGPNMDINGMVPGENHFYKIVIDLSSQPLDLSLVLNTIKTEPVSPVTKSQLLERLKVSWVIKDESDTVISGTSFNGTMLAFLDDNPDAATKTVYNAVDLSAYTSTTVTIYYTIGVISYVEGDTEGASDILQGANFSISEFQLTLS